MRKAVAVLVVTLLACWTPSAGADVVSAVNDLARKEGPPAAAPSGVSVLAIVNLAMFDAANAVERRYEPYRAPRVPAPPGADAEAAALAAGCATLAALQPKQKASIEPACQAMTPAASTDAVRRFGEAIAADIVAMRRDAGLDAPNRYRPITTAGTYVPTAVPIGWEVARAKPLALSSPSQFRPGPPPSLASATWTRDYDEVKLLGSSTSAARTPEQQETALYWSLPGATMFADSMSENAPRTASPTERARFYALAYVAMFDAAVAQFDAKYAYNFWRPVTAIRNGDLDGNPDTAQDLGWSSLLEAPPHPEYPCAHCTTAAAFATIVAALSTAERPIMLRGRGNARREYANAAGLVEEVVNARIWSGFHYRTSGEVGGVLGRQVAEYVLSTQLRALR